LPTSAIAKSLPLNLSTANYHHTDLKFESEMAVVALVGTLLVSYRSKIGLLRMRLAT